jgi:Ca2+-binding EF-hand superfamily protein
MVSLTEFSKAVSQQNDAVATAFTSSWEAVLDFALSPKGGQSLARQFELMDEDKSGELDFDELGRGLAKCGVRLTPREQRLFLRSLDESGDGKVRRALFLPFAPSFAPSCARLKLHIVYSP